MKYWLIQRTVTRPVPAQAKVERRGSERVAILVSRDGKKKTYSIHEHNGRLMIRTKSRNWYARFRDENSQVQEVNTQQSDKSKANTIAHNYFLRLERIRLGIATEEEFDSKDKLATPITQVVEEFLAASEGKGNSDRYTDDQLRLLERLFIETKVKLLSDIDSSRMVEWMNNAAKKKLSAKTINSYVKQAKQLTKYCLKTGYLTRDPLQYVEYRRAPNDQQEKRRAFKPEEFWKLIDATFKRPIAEFGRETRHKPGKSAQRRRDTWTKDKLTPGNFEACFERGKERLKGNPELLEKLQIDGRERQLMYKIFAYTGMRLNELRSIRLSDIQEHNKQMFIVLRAQYAKNRKSFPFTIPSFLEAEFRDWIEYRKSEFPKSKRKGRNANLFTVPDQLVRILDKDLVAAGIPKKDDRGRAVNVHAFRHTYCTWLQATGVSPRIVQELMRHSSPELTANTYTHADQLDLGGSIEKLPNHSAPKVPPKSKEES
jgi:integrase